MNDLMSSSEIEKNRDLIASLREEYDILLNKTFTDLEKAKSTHMLVENMYIPNMNFTEVANLIQNTIAEIE